MHSKLECWSKHFSSHPASEHEKAIRASVPVLCHGNGIFSRTIPDILLFHSDAQFSFSCRTKALLKAPNFYQGHSVGHLPDLLQWLPVAQEL